MILSIFVLLAAICVQSDVVYSQYGGYGAQNMGFNPYSWESAFNSATAKSWLDYFNKAHEIAHQFQKQWDKVGASNMVALGMQYAQQAAKEFDKVHAAHTSHASHGHK